MTLKKLEGVGGLVSLNFEDDLPKDPLTGGDGHIYMVKHIYIMTAISIELWSTFYIHESIQSREIQSSMVEKDLLS